MRRLAVLLLIGLWSLPAPAAELSATADRLLWCGSAFFWLATDAYDFGADAEAQQYETWSDDLAGRVDMVLQAEGHDDEAIAALRDDYDGRVVTEMGTPGAKYDVTACPDLVVSAAN